MPDPKRVEFITRHFKDLQSIRFAPIPALMLLAPLMPSTPPHVSRGVAWGILLSFLFSVIGFYWWSTGAIKRRYGSVRLSHDETQRMFFHPAIFVPFAVVVAIQSWFFFFDRRNYHWEVYAIWTLLSMMLRPILDSTNPGSRRVVWAIGLVALFGVGSFLIWSENEAIFSLAGVVWLSISIFDFLLLRRTFAGISASPSSGATDVVASYG